MKYFAISILFCFFLVQEALGHGKKISFLLISFSEKKIILTHIFSGAMYYPNPWWETNDCLPGMSPETCKFDLEPPKTGCEGRCRRSMGLTSFFTNYTVVEKRTLPKKFLDDFTRSKSPAGKHPWNSPGAAPIFGNGCGANGGNPLPRGCIGDGK